MSSKQSGTVPFSVPSLRRFAWHLAHKKRPAVLSGPASLRMAGQRLLVFVSLIPSKETIAVQAIWVRRPCSAAGGRTVVVRPPRRTADGLAGFSTVQFLPPPSCVSSRRRPNHSFRRSSISRSRGRHLVVSVSSAMPPLSPRRDTAASASKTSGNALALGDGLPLAATSSALSKTAHAATCFWR